MSQDTPRLFRLGEQAYLPCLEAMQGFTRSRHPETPDQIWFLTHPALLTLGVNGDPQHIHAPHTLPVYRSDRGGQVTWHGPGQLVVYTLIDLRRRHLGIRALVTRLELAIIELLGHYGIFAIARPEAPGVYVNDKKIASVGLKVVNGCSYHGISLNVNPDFSGFEVIHPCGHPGLAVTSLERCGIATHADEIMNGLAASLISQLQRNPQGPNP